MLSILLTLALILAVVGVVMAIVRRPWEPWFTGAGLLFVIWLVITLLVH